MRARNLIITVFFILFILATIFVFKSSDSTDNLTKTTSPTGFPDIDIDELIEKTIQQTQAVGTYVQETTISYDYSAISGSETRNKSMEMTMTARVDNNNRRLWASVNSTFRSDGNPVDIDVEMYSTGDSLYIDMTTDGQSPGWIRSEQLEASWNKLVSFDNALAVMEKELVGSTRTDTHRDTGCYVLVIPVNDTNMIYRILKNSFSLENQFRYSWELMQAFSGHFIFEIWIEKDTFIITKTVISLDVDVSDEEVPQLKADSAAHSLLMTSYNYSINKPLVVTLPEKLKDAAIIYTVSE